MPGKLNKIFSCVFFPAVLIMLGKPHLSAQVEPMPSYNLYTPDYQTYRVEKELYSFNTIRYMFQDRNKKLWISTAHDFKRTNGYHFFSLPEIAQGVTHNIDHISHGHPWNDSINYLVEQKENQSLRSLALHFNHPVRTQRLDDLQNYPSNLLFYDVIWNENVYEVRSDSLQELTLRVVTPEGRVSYQVKLPRFEGSLTHFCVTRENVWFVLDNQKIVCYTLSPKGELISPVHIQAHDNIRIFHSDRLGNLWLSTWDGIYQIRNFSNGSELTKVAALPHMEMIFEDDLGNLIFGSTSFPRRINQSYLYIREGGRWIDLQPLIHELPDLHFFTGNDFQKELFIGAQNSLSTLRFTDHPISKDIFRRNGSDLTWEFNAKGIYKTDSTFFTLVTHQGLWVRDMISGKEELIKFQHPVTRESMAFENPGKIEVDTSGRLWFTSGEWMGTDESKYLISYDPRYRKKSMVRFSSPITSHTASRANDLWVSTQPTDKTQTIHHFDVVDQHRTRQWNLPLDIGRINDIYIWGNDTMYLGTDYGFYQFILSTSELARIPLMTNPLLRTIIFSIFYFDDKFFLASRDGLFVYDPHDQNIVRYNNSNGLRNNIVTSVFRERKNKYWLSTLYGVVMLNMDQNLVLNYSVRDGLSDNQFNVHSHFQDDSGFYLGYRNGVLQLNLRDSMVSYFNDFSLDHVQLYYRGEEKPEILLSTDNHVDIPPNVSYIMLFPSSYGAYFVDYYYFKLINTTLNDTLAFSASKGAIISKLNAGTYHFKLKTYDRYGNMIPGEKSYSVTINQHLYQATWFKVLIVLLLNAVVAYMVFCWFRVRNRKRRLAHEQATRLSELELQVLQAQLNPHFIFNTISAIQYYIQDHDVDRADHYLTSFSRLMRMYLDTSKSSFISLQSEIDLLTNYLDLEIMVSDGKFQAHYEVDPDLDLDNTLIPTMTIQPFVENAIQHGLFNKEGQGNIFLRFILLSDEELLCEVEDDGIGRVEAARINAQNILKPESRALKIIDEKIEVLQVTRGVKIDIDIIDKYHEDQPMGTLVRIIFPVMKHPEAQQISSFPVTDTMDLNN